MIARAVEAGIERICVPGWDLASSEAALELASRHPGIVDAAVGIHPHHAAEMDEPAWARLESLVSDSRTRAVGEIGLDYFRNLSPPAVQREALARQLAIAKANDLPVLVHDREAHEDVESALVAWGGRGVLHAFSGDAEMARRLAGAGYVVSFALPVAFGSANGPRAAATALDGAPSSSRPTRRIWVPMPPGGTSRRPCCASSPSSGACAGWIRRRSWRRFGGVRARHRSCQRVNACSSHGTPVAIERRGLMPAHKADTEGGPYGPGQRQRAEWRNHGSRWQ